MIDYNELLAELSNRSSDQTPVVLTADQQGSLLKQLQNLKMVVPILEGDIRKNTLQSGFVVTAISTMQTCMHCTATYTGVPNVSAEEEAFRIKHLRALQQHIETLEHQLGSDQAKSDMRLAVKALYDATREWWQAQGLGFVQDFYLDFYGSAILHLNCRPSPPNMFDFNDEPDTSARNNKAWVEQLKVRGFLVEGVNSSRMTTTDCQKNHELITDLIGTIASAQIQEVLTEVHPKGLRTIKEYRVVVKQPSELLKLASST